MHTVKVVIADDHPILLSGLQALINGIDGFEVVGSASNGEEALSLAVSLDPHIVILDLDMPKLNGLEVAEQLKENHSHIAISILTLHKEESFLQRAIDLGVEGFMLKDFANEEIEKCLRALSSGKKFYSEELESMIYSSAKLPEEFALLSRAEKRVLRLVAENKTSKEIAELLFISPKTIENHRYNIAKKLKLEPKNNSLLQWANKFSKYI